MKNDTEKEKGVTMRVKDEVNKRALEAIRVVLEEKRLRKKIVFAEECGINSATISEVLSGHQRATMPIMVSLCENYNVSADWMLTGRGQMFKAAGAEEAPAARVIVTKNVKDVVNERVLLALRRILDEKGNKIKVIVAESTLSYSLVKEALSGRQRASMAVLTTLCDTYNISAEWILTGRGNMVFEEPCETEADEELETATEAEAEQNPTELLKTIAERMEQREKELERVIEDAKALLNQLEAIVLQSAGKGK